MLEQLLQQQINTVNSESHIHLHISLQHIFIQHVIHILILTLTLSNIPNVGHQESITLGFCLTDPFLN